MRTMTAREQAEAHVALIRQAFPKVVSFKSPYEPFEQCVVTAAINYDASHGLTDHRAWVDRIANLNDAHQFEAAWAALTDYYEERFA